MYDKSGGGSELRKYLSCNLAYWHSFKQATKMIWKGFIREYDMGPTMAPHVSSSGLKQLSRKEVLTLLARQFC